MLVTEKSISTASYLGGGASVLSALTLTDFGILVGIFTALITLIVNIFYNLRRDRRELEAHTTRMAVLKQDLSPGDVPDFDRKTCTQAGCAYANE